jgi:hypothetical protein
MSSPPLATIVVPCMLGAIMLTLAAIDLGVDLTSDSALIAAWYGAAPIPVVKHFFKFVLMPALPLLTLKILLKSIPGALKGIPGSLAGCVPLVVLPTVIALTIVAKNALDPALAARAAVLAGKRAPATVDVDAAVLAHVTLLHAVKVVVSLTMPASAVSEYVLASAHAKRKQQ